MLNDLLKPSKEKYTSTLHINSLTDALLDFTRAYNSSVHRSIKMAPAQVTMSNLNSKRIKNEERMKKKTLLSLKLGTLSGSHVPEKRSQGHMVRGGVVNCSK